ncbi:hypothetical protein [Lactococcus lactis]|nr:hypothetical protein [Lactococcus lactis]MDG4957929.1 hypothetical protein [Lactococcus lactis]
MGEEKYQELMLVATNFVINQLQNKKKKSPAMVAAIAELITVITQDF